MYRVCEIKIWLSIKSSNYCRGFEFDFLASSTLGSKQPLITTVLGGLMPLAFKGTYTHTTPPYIHS